MLRPLPRLIAVAVVLVCLSVAAANAQNPSETGKLRIVLQPIVYPGMQFNPADVVRVLGERLSHFPIKNSVTESSWKEYDVAVPADANKDAIVNLLTKPDQLQIVWFKDVESGSDPKARYKMIIAPDQTGRLVYSFTDTTGGNVRTFRDEAQIAALHAPRVSAHGPSESTIRALNQELRDWKAFYALELAASGHFLSPNGPPRPLLSNADIAPTASASVEAFGRKDAILNIQFTGSGTKVFSDFTSRHTHSVIGIVVDGRILSAPSVLEPIRNGECELMGGFANVDEARNLAACIDSAPLPAPMHVVRIDRVPAND
jgi:preprotein translocase subunit SecD